MSGRIHFIGICGTAMATLAAMLKNKGFDVSGSDQDVYPPMSDFLAAERIPCDVCPTSNVRLNAVPDLSAHPLPAMLESGVPVTINADDQLFFGSGVASAEGEGGAAAEAVKAGIRQIIEAETEVLSDDAIAALLKQRGFDCARRTVVKYREAMGIGSSIQRRRLRKIAG